MSFEHLKRDAARYQELGAWWTCPGFWIGAVYRFGVWADQRPFPWRLPMWLLYRLAHLPYWLFNVHLWAGKRGARIGPGLFLIHPNNLYFPPGVELGEDCTIFHEVTMGTGHAPGFPRLGDRVTVYAGARLLGGIHIGHDVMIGANCVVGRDVPADTIVMPPTPKYLPRALSPRARLEDSRLDTRAFDPPSRPAHD